MTSDLRNQLHLAAQHQQDVWGITRVSKLLHEAEDRIEALEAKVERLRADLDRVTRGTYSLELGRLSKVNADLRARIPDPDDLRTVVTNVSGPRNPVNNAEWWAAVDRLCATLEGEA